MEDTQWDQTDVHNFYRAGNPAVFDRHKMYWCSFKKNPEQPGKVIFTIYMFDFEKPLEPKKPVFTREEDVVFGNLFLDEDVKAANEEKLRK